MTTLPDLHDGFFAAAAAAKRNVDVTPVDRYSQGRVRPQELQLGSLPWTRRRSGAEFASSRLHWRVNGKPFIAADGSLDPE